MKTTGFSGLLCVALAMFALPAAAQAAGQSTPATSGLCDELADATPGLQGLCVAMCEAQTCEAKINAAGEVEFGPNCGPSAPQLLANYDRLAGPADPPMPCVNACPCWTRAELENIGGSEFDSCTNENAVMYLQGGQADRGVTEYAGLWENGSTCISNEAGFSRIRDVRGLGVDAYAGCLKTLTDLCTARELLD